RRLMDDSNSRSSRPRSRATDGARVAPTAGSRLAVLLAMAFIAAGCASSPPAEPESMRDPQANFASYQTFGWKTAVNPGSDEEPVKLLDSNIRAAIANELKKRGYTEAPAGVTPDLQIAYDTASADKLENNPVRVGIGVGGWGGGNVGGSVNVGSPSVRNYKEGTLVVHAIDTARNAEVWQGRVSKKITKGSVEPAAIAAAVASAMEDFPAR
ncbi:MAG: hypothetical protein K0R70_1916, partial [Steroidobacteraceae bacterium]|nr:hypothetical protein [Steroidobacteraceae bacterium]